MLPSYKTGLKEPGMAVRRKPADGRSAHHWDTLCGCGPEPERLGRQGAEMEDGEA